MNKDRRKALDDIISKLESIQDTWDEIKNDLETVKDEEQEYYDNMPEGLQQSDRGYTAEQAVDNMDTVYWELDGIDISSFIDQLRDAQA